MWNLLFSTFDARCSTLVDWLAIFEAACWRAGLAVPVASRFSFLLDLTKKGADGTRNCDSIDREKIRVRAASQPRVFRSGSVNTRPHEIYVCTSGIPVENSTEI